MSKQTMLITGATGRQGGAAARAAVRAGLSTRALVRSAQTPAAQRLAASGVELVLGDLSDRASLAAACAGVDSVFSVQQRPSSRGGYGLNGGGSAASAAAARSAEELDPDTEFHQGRNLIEAARDAGVPHVIQATAAMARRGSTDSSPTAAKLKTEELLVAAGLPAWTILRPGFFMENLPTYLSGDRMVTGMSLDTTLGLIACDDIGSAAVSAAIDRDRFSGQTIALVGDIRTWAEIGAILTVAWGRPIGVSPLSDEDAVALGLAADLVAVHRHMATRSSPADPAEMRAFGLQVTELASWATANLPDPDTSPR